jgi:hypothetical protein
MTSYEAGIYDFYDDKGALLQERVPDAEDIPDFVKAAAAMSPDDSPQLYALVMLEDGKVLKKYATADSGNTWLSTLYFAFTKDNLPEEAQKIAAANLVEACEAFEIAPPDFLFDYADGPAETNMIDVSGMSLPTKLAADDREDVTYAIDRADGSKHYPLDNSASVAAALEYFDRNAGQFEPRERREFAVKTAAAAAKGSLPVPESVARYSSDSYNPSLEGHLTARFTHLMDADASPAAKAALMKVASLRTEVEPEEFAQRLEAFDKAHGLDAMWDRWVADPWYSTLGLQKVAKGNAPSPTTYKVGEVTVTQHELETLAERGISNVRNLFGDKVADQFVKEPQAVFESLPLPNRKLLARLATSHSDDEALG